MSFRRVRNLKMYHSEPKVKNSIISNRTKEIFQYCALRMTKVLPYVSLQNSSKDPNPFL